MGKMRWIICFAFAAIACAAAPPSAPPAAVEPAPAPGPSSATPPPASAQPVSVQPATAFVCGEEVCDEVCCAHDADDTPICDTQQKCDAAGKAYRIECDKGEHCGGEGMCQVGITGRFCVEEVDFTNATQACEETAECADVCAMLGQPGKTTCIDRACSCQ